MVMALMYISLTSVLFMIGSIWCIESNFTLSTSTLPTPTLEHFAVVFDNKLTVFAGKESKDGSYPFVTVSQTATIHNTLETIQWNPNNLTLPFDITGLGDYSSDCSVTVNDKIYIINPFTTGGTLSSIERYHQLFVYTVTSNQFTVLPKPTHKAGGICVVYNDMNNILYAMGGYSGGHLKYTQRFNISNNSWIKDAAVMPVGAWHPGCCIDDTKSKIFLFGGDIGGYYWNGIQSYNVSNNSWIIASAILSEAKIDPKCRFFMGNIYCIGGLDTNAQNINAVDIFDTITETITNTIYLNIARWQFTATLWNDNQCLIITGGTVLDSIETMGDCIAPTATPTNSPTASTNNPTVVPTNNPTATTDNPTVTPTRDPITNTPSKQPTTSNPTLSPEEITAASATYNPTALMIILCIISIVRL